MHKDTKRHITRLGIVAGLAALALWISLPEHPSIQLGAFGRDLNVKLGLDLQGGSHLVYRAEVDPQNLEQSQDALAGVRDVIERRVNAFGVAEPIVQTNRVGDEYRIIVELAGVFDPEEAIRQIGETPQLDFRKEVRDNVAINIDGPAAITEPLFEETSLTGRHLRRANVEFDPTLGTPEVTLNFDGDGGKLFAELTKENIGKRIAIYLDGVPISAPVVQAEITNGQAVISGGFTLEEAKQLASRLNAGALPIAIELIGQQSVGPSLGKLSITQSLRAGAYGMLAVAVWMIVFYRLPGVVASLALAIYALLFFALIKIIPVTMTLAGIAGFILSIGMAVDANVLIFERFRENLRARKTVAYALQDGFREAWDSIKASNISSLLTALVLYIFGTSIVRGFAVTFSLGILLSMFTAIVVTRSILALLLAHRATHKPFLLAVPTVHKSQL